MRFSGLANTAVSLALLTMAASGAAPPGELRDIAGPVEMPDDPVWHWYAVAVAGAAAVAGAVALVVRRRRAAERAAAEAAALLPDPPYEEAMKALHQLAGERLDTEALYTRLTEIVRRYVARRFGVDAAEATSAELLGALRGAIAEEHERLLRAFFTEADLVKFAAFVPAAESARRAVEVCRGFVRETAMEAGRAL